MWFVFIGVVLVALAIDFFAMNRQGAHRVTIREAGLWSLVWVGVSLLFCTWLWWSLGGTGTDEVAKTLAGTKATEFLTGYLIEKALAVDNIFVFLLIFTFFSVPLELQKKVLMYGILGALFLRTLMILLGAWLIEEFHAILYVFGAFLIYTGIQMWRSIGKEPDLNANPAIAFIRKRMTVSPHYDGENFFTQIDGRRVATPLLLAVAVIGVVDVIFAVDSIPAIFAVTTDPYIVLTSNVFAILGLRAMYFLLASVHEKFHLLSYGLALILSFIGTKMLIIDVYKIPVVWSLAVTFTLLAGSVILSVLIPAKGRVGSAYPFAPKEENLDSGV